MKFCKQTTLKFSTLASGFLSMIPVGLIPVDCWAAGDGHSSPGIESLVWPLINFVLYVLLMRYFYGKFARPAMLNRSASIAEKLKRASSLIANAERDLVNARDRWERIDIERREIIERIAHEGRHSAAAIVQAAKSSAAELKHDVERRINNEHNQAVMEVRNAVISKATALAREHLALMLSPEKDYFLRQETLGGLW